MKRPSCKLSLFLAMMCVPALTATASNQTVPKGKILSMFEEMDTNIVDGRTRHNKTHKILTRPLQTTTTTPHNPYFMYPQNPGFIGDSAAQGSGPQAINVQHPPLTNNFNQQHPPLNNNFHNQQRPPLNNNQQRPPLINSQQHPVQQKDEIPDFYVQLIGAIEKLVGRMDKLDTRVRTVENIIYHMTNKKEELPEQGSCPNNFRKVEGVRGKCFQVSSYTKNPNIYDWKSAENECTKVGGRLVEMLNYEDFIRVSQFLIKYNSASNSATSDYWIGGINPGLIWIWAESGQPVDMNKRYWNDNDNNSAIPGCLKLSYSHRLNTYFFKHSPCGHSQNYICEIMDNTISRALATFEEQLWNESGTL